MVRASKLPGKPQAEPRFAIAIMAAGKGTRLKSRHPKVLHQMGGKPMLAYVVAAARRGAGAGYVRHHRARSRARARSRRQHGHQLRVAGAAARHRPRHDGRRARRWPATTTSSCSPATCR